MAKLPSKLQVHARQAGAQPAARSVPSAKRWPNPKGTSGHRGAAASSRRRPRPAPPQSAGIPQALSAPPRLPPSPLPPTIPLPSEAAAGLSSAPGPSVRSKPYDVFRFPVIDWDFRWQRPQHMSVQFASQGYRVFYLSNAAHAIDSEHAAYEDIARTVTVREVRANVWLVKLCSHRALNVYRDKLSDALDLKYLQWSLEHVKRLFGIRRTVSIVDLPFWAPLASALKDNRVIYDRMDDHAGFSTNSAAMLSAEEALVREADLVVVSSQSLLDRTRNKNGSAELIRNGADYAFFADLQDGIAEELQGIEGPVIGYYGAIAEWFDTRLVAWLAARNKHWTFVLIGHTFGCDTSPLEGLDNVQLLGEKPYEELPRYVHRFDVCLIPFLINGLTMATNPVKMYEYLAAGKPVVSVRLPELELAGDAVFLADSPEQFEEAVRTALRDNEQHRIAGRQRFARANTWEKRYRQMHEAIESRLFPKVSIVIVTYNQWMYTQRCLDSLLKDNDDPNVEIVVVDNASTDETRGRLSQLSHPRLKIVYSWTNAGFAGGNAHGCRAASGDYIVLLNNDTIVPPGGIYRLVKPLIDNPELGLAGPMSNYVGNDQMVDFFDGDPIRGADQHWLDHFYRLYRGRRRETELLGFFCVAMKREVYEQLGELDRGYEIGMFEDDDYCERVKRAGYRLAIVEDAFVYHHGSVSFKRLDEEAYAALWNKNKRYFEQKWNKAWAAPQPPATVFFQVTEPEDVAEKVKETGQKSILVLGGKHWPVERQRWQLLTEALAADGRHLVVAYVHTYHTKDVIGIRKAGPSIYLTNRIDLFEACRFDLIVYCGQTELYPIRSGFIAIDAASSRGSEIRLQAALPQAVLFNEPDVAALARQLAQQIGSEEA